MSVAEKTDFTKQGNCPMTAEPTKEHQWLQQLVGEWTAEMECVMGPDQPPMNGPPMPEYP